jgi:hypothetical protein
VEGLEPAGLQRALVRRDADRPRRSITAARTALRDGP